MPNIITGTDGDDSIWGVEGDDIIYGGKGKDYISGYPGNDQLFGGAGDDYLTGHAGDDLMDGGEGDDRLDDNSGNNIFVGGAGNDTIAVGGYANAVNSVDGGDGDDRVEVNGGQFSKLEGGAGTDTLFIHQATLHNFTATGAGFEIYAGGGFITGTAGEDHIDFSGMTYAAGTSGMSFDLGAGNDTLYATDLADQIALGSGNNFVDAGAGNDYATGGVGDDYLAGGDGDDTMIGYGGNDTYYGGAGNDRLGGGGGDADTDKIFGDEGNDELTGGSGDNWLDGGAGNDTIWVNGLHDHVFGGDGDDTVHLSRYQTNPDELQGGAGSDTLVLENGVALGQFSASAQGYEHVKFFPGQVYGTDGNDSIDFSGVTIDFGMPSLSAGKGNDHVVGTDQNDLIYGETGNDVLEGGAGDDRIDGGNEGGAADFAPGTDIASYAHATGAVSVDLSIQGSAQDVGGGAGKDTLVGIEGVEGSAYNDVLKGGEGGDTILGGAGGDVIYGHGRFHDVAFPAFKNPNDPSVNPHPAQEILKGGAGADTYMFETRLDWGQWVEQAGGDVTVTSNGGIGWDLGYIYNYQQFGGDTATEVEFKAAEGDKLMLGLTSGIAKITSAPDYIGAADGLSYQVVDGHTRVYRTDAFYHGMTGGSDPFVHPSTWIDLSTKVDLKQQAPGSTTYVGLAIQEGTGGNDVLSGEGATSDSLYGGAGDDVLKDFGSADDWYDGGDGYDTVDYSSAAAGVTVKLALQGVDQDTGGAGVDKLTGIEAVTGSAFADKLYGDGFDNILKGGAGDDLLSGGFGNDQLDGGAGADTYQYVLTQELGQGDGKFPGGFDEQVVLDDGDRIDLSRINQTLFYLGQSAFTGHAGEFRTESFGNDTLVLFDTDGDGQADRHIKVLGKVQLGYVGGMLQSTALHAIDGTARGDTLNGTAAADRISGYAGNDKLLGNAGDDFLYGGDGNDQLDGGVGGDRMEGGQGDDTYGIDSINDTVVENAGEGTDTVRASIDYALGANVENLVLTGAATNGYGNDLANRITANDLGDKIDGFGGNDTVVGGAGNDQVHGGDGNDLLYGGEGANTLYGDAGNDSLFGGSGTDTLIGGVGDDKLSGGAGKDSLDGGEGNDALDGGTGDDVMTGGAGNDTYYVDAVRDVIVEAANEGVDTVRTTIDYVLSANIENVILSGAAARVLGNDSDNRMTGNDLGNVLDGGAGNDLVTGGAGVDELHGSGGDDKLYGLAGNDDLYGGDGSDVLDGGQGVDHMTGGAGNDTYYVDSFGELVTEAANEGVDTVRSSVAYQLGANVENLVLTGDAKVGTGNALDNRITGNDGGDTLDGADGNDQIAGGSGADTLLGGSGDDKLTGAAGADKLDGGGGNDALDGGLGADRMEGGAGNDSYIVDDAGDVVIEIAGGGTDSVRSSVDLGLGGEVENLTLVGTAHIGAGNDLDNRIICNDAGDTIHAAAGNDQVTGGTGQDSLYGDAGNDTLTGGAGTDSLYGGDGNDVLIGGTGQDYLYGEGGNDTFRFLSVDDFAGDVVYFDAGDKIDLKAIDANVSVAGDQAFAYIGDTAFTGHAGELRGHHIGFGIYQVEADVNGDGVADFAFTAVNVGGALSATTFLL